MSFVSHILRIEINLFNHDILLLLFFFLYQHYLEFINLISIKHLIFCCLFWWSIHEKKYLYSIRMFEKKNVNSTMSILNINTHEIQLLTAQLKLSWIYVIWWYFYNDSECNIFKNEKKKRKIYHNISFYLIFTQVNIYYLPNSKKIYIKISKFSFLIFV